jgi:hypothetical protein
MLAFLFAADGLKRPASGLAIRLDRVVRDGKIEA